MAGPKKPSISTRLGRWLAHGPAGNIGQWLAHAPRVASVFDKLGELFGGKPTPPTLLTKPLLSSIPSEEEKLELEFLGEGHRGAALVSREHPDLSPENRAKWRALGNDAMAGFVYGMEVIYFHSSNVTWAQYFLNDRSMLVAFHGGSPPRPGVYKVSPISEAEAIDLARAFSKGIWYWDNVRRGGKNASRVR